MTTYHSFIEKIASQKEEMIELLKDWVSINSGSFNTEGLHSMLKKLGETFKVLNPDHTEILSIADALLVNESGEKVSQALGSCLRLTKRPEAPIQIFLGGHMDTVFPKESSFQNWKHVSEDVLVGPGVSDLKGGLVILLYGLAAFEQSPLAEKIGWQILINPDEEIGSPGSAPIISETAKGKDLAIIFEPSLEDGAFVSARKGSANYALVSKGRSSHVGRAFDEGRNAFRPLMEVLTQLDQLNESEEGLILNVGSISGGGPLNVVPELAIGKWNMRLESASMQKKVEDLVDHYLKPWKEKEGYDLEWTCLFSRPPKPFDEATESLFQQIKSCTEELGYSSSWRATGGVCDGNIVAQQNVPTIDTMGAKGGKIHTSDEYIFLDSLVERAQLLSLYLFKLASGDFPLPKNAQYASCNEDILKK